MTTTADKRRPYKDREVEYQHFLAAVQELSGEGRRPTIRALHDKLGKSNSTLIEFRDRWLQEKEQAGETSESLSEGFMQAVLAEIGRATKKIKLRHQELLAEYKEQVSNYKEQLKEVQAQLVTLTAEDQERQMTAQARELDFEKKLAASLALTEQARNQVVTLQAENKIQAEQMDAQLAKIREEKHQADLPPVFNR